MLFLVAQEAFMKEQVKEEGQTVVIVDVTGRDDISGIDLQLPA